MDQATLDEIVQQRLDVPTTAGRLATMVSANDLISQRHHDGRELKVLWRDTPGYRRCTIFKSPGSDLAFAQIDLHADGTFRVEAWEPCSITLSVAEDLLVLHRYRR